MASMRYLAPRNSEDGCIVRLLIVACQGDGDFGPPHLDVPNTGDPLSVIGGGIGSKVPADRIDNAASIDAGDGACGLRPSLDQCRGDVIAVRRHALAAMARAFLG